MFQMNNIEFIRAGSGRDASPHPSQAGEDADEQYRKTA